MHARGRARAQTRANLCALVREERVHARPFCTLAFMPFCQTVWHIAIYRVAIAFTSVNTSAPSRIVECLSRIVERLSRIVERPSRI
eukprot:2263090-Pleurochrysis_carterae.AAC.1